MTNLSAPKANKFPPTSNLMLIKSKSQFDILTRDETVPYDEIKAFCNSRGSQRTTERSVDSEHGNMVSNTILFFNHFLKANFTNSAALLCRKSAKYWHVQTANARCSQSEG